MANPIKESTGLDLPEHTITYVTTTQGALEALARLATSHNPAADTETVARDDEGVLRDLNIYGPGPLRVLVMAGKIDGVIESYVLDMAPCALIDPEVAELYHVSGTTNINRPALAEVLKDFTAFAWNADFDERVLEEAAIPLHTWKDLMLAHASLILGEWGVGFYDGLDFASRSYLKLPLAGKGTIQLSYTENEPLSADQILYAALDGVTTCALADEIMPAVESSALVPTVDIEWKARPFRSQMERRGIYFDTAGWRKLLADHQTIIDETEVELANATGGGKGNLFDFVERPLWNPGSQEDVKRTLNQYAPDDVKRQLGGRLFEKSDSVGSAMLQLLNNPLANLVLLWRKHTKTLSTYGESFMDYIRPDGRVHARYLQNVVSTGRMSSSYPNMQNIDPTMKHYYQPEITLMRVDGKWQATPGARVFVMGDLSQAELRFAAEISGDEALVAAFLRGDDMHVVTASRMFKIDMDDLYTSDRKEYDIYRQRGKTMNFAVIYGLGPRALAETLTLAKVPTTEDEAKNLLRLYLAAFPKMAKWLESRDAYIKSLTSNPPRCDFNLSLKLMRLLPLINKTKKELEDQDVVTSRDIALAISSAEEISTQLTSSLGRAPSADELEVEILRRTSAVDAAQKRHAAVILLEDGTPFSFESRTTVGRRRTFNVPTKYWIDSIIMSVMRATRGNMKDIRLAFEADSREKLTAADGSNLSRDVIKKRFEKKELRDSFVSFILKNLGSQTETVFNRALSDCIGGQGNAYRNAPIQGGVADAVMMAFGLLHERLKPFNDAFMVQSVHDSIVIECDASEALELSKVLQETMKEALSYFCPSVPAKADIDISISLDATAKYGHEDKIEIEDLERLYPTTDQGGIEDELEIADLDIEYPAVDKDGNQIWMKYDVPLSEDPRV